RLQNMPQSDENDIHIYSPSIDVLGIDQVDEIESNKKPFRLHPLNNLSSKTFFQSFMENSSNLVISKQFSTVNLSQSFQDNRFPASSIGITKNVEFLNDSKRQIGFKNDCWSFILPVVCSFRLILFRQPVDSSIAPPNNSEMWNWNCNNPVYE